MDAHVPDRTLPEPVGWLHFLPRWSLMVGTLTLALPLVFVGSVGQQAADTLLGPKYTDLLQAMRSPGMYRLGWLIDAFVWLLLGGTLFGLAGLVRRHAPLRAGFIAVCGIGQVIGSLGSFLRLHGTGGLATLYATAASEQQAAFLELYLNQLQVIDAHNHLGVLLQGVGFVLAAWSVFSLPGFPRWLAAWLVLPGLLAVVQFSLVAAGLPFWRPLNLVGVVAGNISLHFALALALWRPSDRLLSAVAGASPGR